VWLQSFLTSALDAGWRSTKRPVRYTSGKEPRYAMNRSFGGPQSRYGRFGEKKIFLPPSRLEHRSYSPYPSRYTYYATQASHSVPIGMFA
jgi:hypothetical protein